MKAPRISVLMPLRDAAAHLPEALDSLWAQTWRDFEVLAVDDGSRDATADILKAAAGRQPRLRILKTPRPGGLVAALNFAWSKARGAFVARMDGDDRCHPRRFELQAARLEREPSIGLLGTAVRAWKGSRLSPRPVVTGHEAIAARLAFENPMAHPTVMWRRSAVGRRRYAPGWRACEDYELWTRLAATTRLANLEEPLLDYRIHPSQSGASQGLDQYLATTRLRGRYLKSLGFQMGPRQLEAHAALCPPFMGQDPAQLPALRKWITELLEQNESLGAFEPAILLSEARQRFASYCLGLGLRGAAFYAARGGGLRSSAFWSKVSLRAGLKGIWKRAND